MEHNEELAEIIAAIVSSLKVLGYANAHYTYMHNQEKGHLILADTPDGKVHFSIGVDTWEPMTN